MSSRGFNCEIACFSDVLIDLHRDFGPNFGLISKAASNCLAGRSKHKKRPICRHGAKLFCHKFDYKRQTIDCLGSARISARTCDFRYFLKGICPRDQSRSGIVDQSLSDPQPSSIALCHCARSQANAKSSIALSKSPTLHYFPGNFNLKQTRKLTSC